MEPHAYEVAEINGDYAGLRRLDGEDDALFTVAMALLPPGVDIGTKLTGMMGMFEIIE
ncbi:MAG: chorismate--pyruvate lyase [Oscillospiraceae bacterium]|nr:chorismate--pyruvate lyase [Oscillospiraceae bacterium]